MISFVLPPLLDSVVTAGAPALKFYDSLREVKKQMIVNAVERAGGSYVEAAKLLSIPPNNPRRLMRNLGLKRSPDK